MHCAIQGPQLYQAWCVKSLGSNLANLGCCFAMKNKDVRVRRRVRAYSMDSSREASTQDRVNDLHPRRTLCLMDLELAAPYESHAWYKCFWLRSHQREDPLFWVANSSQTLLAHICKIETELQDTKLFEYRDDLPLLSAACLSTRLSSVRLNRHEYGLREIVARSRHARNELTYGKDIWRSK